MQLPDINLDAISDPATREVVQQLLNIIEALAAENAALRAENQHLRDENARLKGGSGKPKLKPSVPPSTDHSSQAERHIRTPRGKPKKNQTLTVTREQRCRVDPATLPPDARFNGTRETIAQNLIFTIEVIRFLREEWFIATSLPAPLRTRLRMALPWECDLTRAELAERLQRGGIRLGRQQLQQLGDALAVAAYHAQSSVPIVEWLLSDDATVYEHLSEGHGLCWVHDWRHYAKLRPVVANHLRALQTYRTKYWELYRGLLQYRLSPSEAEHLRLSKAFERLTRCETGYDALDERIRKTADKREQLLAVLELPDIPLHNNDMELAARRRVRKRDVSFGPQSRAGARAWDRFQTIAATAAKLGVGLFLYLHDRLVSPETTPALAERIAQCSPLAAQPAG